MPDSNDTIFAPATAAGRAGISVVRISGPAAGRIAKALAGMELTPRRATLALLLNPQTCEPIDRALLLWFPAPNSFTGEDILEIQGHGSRAVTEKLLEVLAHFDDCRLAEPGEFARRAFENGKMDLTAIEGLADLINAETEAQRLQAFRQSEGELGKLYESWREQIIAALALMEAMLDFSDEEEIGEELYGEARLKVEALARSLQLHLNDASRGERLRDGFQVVIAGAPNVGKSSLLNVLAKRDAAIISSEAGTTRDVIEVRLDIGGYPVLVMDTAGVRETEGLVEREGIRRTIARAAEADLVLWLEDPDSNIAERSVRAQFQLDHPDVRLWRILSKADLQVSSGQNPADIPDFSLSAHSGAGLDELLERLQGLLAGDERSTGEPLITRARHRQQVEAAHEALSGFLSSRAEDPELRAEDLRQAALALGRLTGRIDVEELLGHIFGEFCIGK